MKSKTFYQGCAAAQIFSAVSPEMHEEFALNYEKRWLDRFGLTCYGCCEPLHRKIRILKKIRNLCKVSISPYADLEEAVTSIENKYVISLKPSPAILAAEVWDPDAARKKMENKLSITKNCSVEIIMKDISTVRYEPQRLWEWIKIASEATERYAS